MSFANQPPADFQPDDYLACLVAVARADGEASDAEREYVAYQARYFGRDPEALWDQVEDGKVAGRLEKLSYATKIFVLRDCVILAHIDGSYDESERDRILQLVRAMDVREERFIELEKWLGEYFRLMARGERLFSAP